MDSNRSYYNSANSHVLATREDSGGNVRMLLYKPHPPIEGGEPARREFVVGSYFHADEFPDGVTDYAWTWGNYFADVSDAVAFWNESAPRAGEGG